MTLKLIQNVLPRDLARDAWVTDNEIRGKKVARFRRYADGEHDANMTIEMKNLLRISVNRDTSEFTSNQCDNIIQTMTDRLHVEGIEGQTAEATKWSAEVLDFNRFDGLQIDAHEATIRDADSYVLVEYDNDEQMPYFCHEPAWDGRCGMMVIPQSDNQKELAAAIKVWNETRSAYADTLRANVYYPDRIEKWVTGESGQLTRYDDPKMPGVWPIPWLLDGEALGVPAHHFRNKSRGGSGFGLSELEDALPLQDGLNRTMNSMVFAAELTAFRIFIAKGFKPPAAITPGMIVGILSEGGGPITKEQVADFTAIDGADIEQYLKLADWFIGQMEDVTRTPDMKTKANLSGEALKQSEVKLLGKVRRFQVKAGNVWEDVMATAQRVQMAYGKTKPPENKRWRTRWQDPQMRNDLEVLQMAQGVREDVGTKEFLRILAPILGYDESKIDEIMAERGAEIEARMQAMGRSFPAYGGAPLSNGNQPQPVNNGATA